MIASEPYNKQAGISSVAILVVLLIVVTLGLGGLSIWSYLSYADQRDNVNQKVAAAVSQAKTDQTAADQTVFAEQEKLPNRQFSGPSDLGSVTFSYPKTWSVYIGNGDGSSGTYTAYLNPGSVPTIGTNPQFALHLTIEARDYETVLQTYEPLVKKGSLVSSIVTTHQLSGTRLDGSFSKTSNGSAAIFKVRDKTLTIQTDSPTYVADFNNVIASLTFTP